MSARVGAARLADPIESELRGAITAASSDLLLLPSTIREATAWYTTNDIEILKLSRGENLSLGLLAEDPRVLHEYSSGWVADLTLAILDDARGEVVAAIMTILWLRARRAVSGGTRAGEPAAVPVKITLTRGQSVGEKTQFESITIEGTTDGVAAILPGALRQIEGPNRDRKGEA